MKKSKLAVSLILGAVATSLLIASCAFMFRACAPQPDCSSGDSSSSAVVSSTDTVDKEDCAHENRLEMGLSAKLPVSRKKRKMNRIERSILRIHRYRITLHEPKHTVRCQNLYDVSVHKLAVA